MQITINFIYIKFSSQHSLTDSMLQLLITAISMSWKPSGFEEYDYPEPAEKSLDFPANKDTLSEARTSGHATGKSSKQTISKK